jgi:hypothetical protein
MFFRMERSMAQDFQLPGSERGVEPQTRPLPASPEIRLENEFIGCSGIDLREFQSIEAIQRLVGQMAPGLVQNLTRFAAFDVRHSVSEQAQSLCRDLQSYVDLFEIVRASPARSSLPDDLVGLERQIEGFKVAVNVLDALGQERLGFSDWVAIKREALELRDALIDYRERHTPRMMTKRVQ